MLKANFEMAIRIAIAAEEQHNRDLGYCGGESGYLKGLREILEASKRGERITVEED